MLLSFLGMLLPFFAVFAIGAVVKFFLDFQAQLQEKFHSQITDIMTGAKEERAQLLDRLMARDLPDYATARTVIDKQQEQTPAIDFPSELYMNQP